MGFQTYAIVLSSNPVRKQLLKIRERRYSIGSRYKTATLTSFNFEVK